MSSFSLIDLMDQDLYVYAEPEVLDWTSERKECKIFFCTFKKKICFDLKDKKSIKNLAASFSCVVNNNNLLFGYNLKNIFSFFLGKAGILVDIDKTIYDIAIIQSYFSIPKNKPESLKECLSIIKEVKKSDQWDCFKKFYLNVYNPLIKRVIPKIEINSLVDANKKNFVSCFYEIEGQINGRMKCSSVLDKCFVPHTLNKKNKDYLRTTSAEDIFVYFDYKHMEVSVLQWLSKDENLKSILESGGDLYESIWEKIVKQKANEKQRNICKNFFLPVVFGQGYYSLSKKLGLEEKISKMLIDSLRKTFPTAFKWVDDQTTNAEHYAFDIFGRKRKFEESDRYKIKNFCIQSPASMICLKKLVSLHYEIENKARICFHVHDGYCLVCNKNNLSQIVNLAKNILEKEEDMFPDLKLSVVCKFGQNLNNLKDIK
jgi:hypothetical protein